MDPNTNGRLVGGVRFQMSLMRPNSSIKFVSRAVRLPGSETGRYEQWTYKNANSENNTPAMVPPKKPEAMIVVHD